MSRFLPNMNRFIAKNIFLVGTLSLSVLCILFLTVLAVIQFFKMHTAIEKTNELEERTMRLMRQKPSAIPENVTLIEKNIKGYTEKDRQIKIYFGQPLYPALQAFCKALQADPKLKIDPEELRKDFKEFYDKKGFNIDSNRQQICRDYCDSQEEKPKAQQRWNREKWENAMDVFIEIAQKTTEEKIGDHNYEEIFLSCLGMPRYMGGSEDSMVIFRQDMQKRVAEIFKNDKSEIDILGINFLHRAEVAKIKDNLAFNDRKDRVSADKNNERAASQNTASSSSDSNSDSSNKEAKADEIRHWEIICDLTHRLCKAGVSSIEEISYSNLAGRNERSCNLYTYTLTVTGSEQSVRKLLNLMNAAYKDHRVYVIRSLSLVKQEDQVQDIIDVANKRIGVNAAEEKSQLSTSSNNDSPDFGSNNSNSAQKKLVTEEYYQEKDEYGECVAGRSNIVTATMTFDYVVYNINVTK